MYMNSARIVTDLSPHIERPSFLEYKDAYGNVFVGVTRKIVLEPSPAKKYPTVNIICEWILFAKVMWEFRQRRYIVGPHTPFSKNRIIGPFRLAHSERTPIQGQEHLMLKCIDTRETIELWQHEYDI